jgi:hypothetical protein
MLMLSRLRYLLIPFSLREWSPVSPVVIVKASLERAHDPFQYDTHQTDHDDANDDGQHIEIIPLVPNDDEPALAHWDIYGQGACTAPLVIFQASDVPNAVPRIKPD